MAGGSSEYFSWDPLISSIDPFSIKVGAKIIIDLTGTDVFESAPDAVKYTWSYMGASDPPGTSGGETPNYDYTHYPLLSQYAYMYEDGMAGRSYPSFMVDAASSEDGGYFGGVTTRMYSVHVPTMYPRIESNGLMDHSHAFKYSWFRAAFNYGSDGKLNKEISGDTDSDITGYYGNWNIMDTYYLNYATTTSTFFPVISNSTQGHGVLDAAEFHKSCNVYSNSPRQLDGMILGPALVLNEGDGYYKIYDDVLLTDQEKNTPNWPLYSLVKTATDHTERNFRNYHATLSTDFGTYSRVWRDLYERFYHPTYNNARRDEYFSKRISSLETMLKIAESLPKENRVRMQPQAQIQDSQLGYLPMSSEIASETPTAPATTSTVSTGGGMSSY